MGVKAIASWLNERGLLRRGYRFSTGSIHVILTSSTYCGRHFFNRTDSRNRRPRPPSVDRRAKRTPLAGCSAPKRAPSFRWLNHRAGFSVGVVGWWFGSEEGWVGKSGVVRGRGG